LVVVEGCYHLTIEGIPITIRVAGRSPSAGAVAGLRAPLLASARSRLEGPKREGDPQQETQYAKLLDSVCPSEYSVERTFEFALMAFSLPHPRDSEAKLEHILRHSARIFAEKGFEGASVRDISRATGLSLAGLYYYFDSKQRLLYLIQNNTFTFILARLQSRLAGATEGTYRLRILVGNHIEYFLSHPHEMKVLSHEEEALDEPLHAEIAALKRTYFGLARKIFDELAATGLAPGLNSRVAVLSLFGMMNWVYKWHNPKVDLGAEELTDAIVGIFLHGVLSRERALKDALHEKISPGAPVTVP
jgi:TetR/AcrR family transcriptional regulator, cholesterol catabolism regulator